MLGKLHAEANDHCARKGEAATLGGAICVRTTLWDALEQGIRVISVCNSSCVGLEPHEMSRTRGATPSRPRAPMAATSNLSHVGSGSPGF